MIFIQDNFIIWKVHDDYLLNIAFETEYFAISKEIVRVAEKSKVIEEFTMLNDNFTNRMKDENREVDEKHISDKRLKNNPPGTKHQKRWKAVKEQE